MIIIMKMGAGEEEIREVVGQIEEMGFRAHLSRGEERTIIGVIGDERPVSPHVFELMEGVERTVPILHPFKLASRDFKPEDTIIPINGMHIGSREVVVMAGPCAVESREQLLETAWAIKETGVRILRGGAFKPRTSPYSFQGLGEEGLKILAKVRDETGLLIVTEATDNSSLELVDRYADIIQIGARNMHNYSLLRQAGHASKPVLLKRSFAATIEEWLMSAEYISSEGNSQVILCERGIRTFSDNTRNTLDLSAIPSVKQVSHLPIIVDPSHAAGRRDYVIPLSKGAIAVGADGLLVEVHHDPTHALSDGAQSLYPEQFDELIKEIKGLVP